MDPLSITAGSLTVVGAISSTLKVLKNLNIIDGELDALSVEISEMEMVLVDLEKAILDRQQLKHLQPNRAESLVRLLQNARVRVETINEIVNNKILHPAPPGNEVRIARVAWLRQRASVKNLQESLRQSRERISLFVGAISL
jgi:hypothetical protein